MRIKLKNTYIVISPFFFAIVIWSLALNKQSDFLICLVALIIHELGHIITICLLKEEISVFQILQVGFSCRLKNQSHIETNKLIKIIIAGPVVSLIAAGLFLFWTKEFAIINLIIGLVNLFPVGELDGMRIMNIIIENKIYK